MFDRVTLARLNDEAVIKEALSEAHKRNWGRYCAIQDANPDLRDRIRAALAGKLRAEIDTELYYARGVTHGQE